MPRIKNNVPKARKSLELPVAVIDKIKALQVALEANSETEIIRYCVNLVYELETRKRAGHKIMQQEPDGKMTELVIF